MSEYHGEERRRNLVLDHDLLMRIETKLDNVLVQLKDHEERLRWHDKILYSIGGAWIFVQLLLKFVK